MPKTTPRQSNRAVKVADPPVGRPEVAGQRAMKIPSESLKYGRLLEKGELGAPTGCCDSYVQQWVNAK